MVGQVDRRGLRDWIAQRITALIILAYTLVIMAYLFFCPALNYAAVTKIFNHLLMKMATVATVLAILWHAWIGLWTVLTDYVKPKLTRLFLETVIILLLLSYFVWVVEIFWGA